MSKNSNTPPAIFTPAPPPQSDLAKVKLLAPSAGVRVSPLCLGGMSIGDAWESVMGSMSKEDSFKLLDEFVKLGGNFIDTSSNYQDEQSEKWIGEWMKERGNRDEMVIATKYTTQYRAHEMGKISKAVNYGGNSRKTMHLSVRDSLKKLQTNYIDILYVHWWDWTTSVEEVMDSLHALVQSGKVLYLGISDTPAWLVAHANTYARAHGKTPFVIYQGLWNVLRRDFEREIIPMARHFGMALAPWQVLGGGKFQTKKAIADRAKTGEGLRGMRGPNQTEAEVRMSEALEKVGEEHGGASVTAVALAYVRHKAPYVFPIVGGRKVEHLHDNVRGLGIQLTDEQVEYLERVEPFRMGFPMDIIAEDPHVTGKTPAVFGIGHFNIEWETRKRWY